MKHYIDRQKKDRFIRIISILGILIFFNFRYLDESFAWANGSYAQSPADYSYSTDYSTHDWIAESALLQLSTQNHSQWQWLNDRIFIYLGATEAPDNSNFEATLDGDLIYGYGDTTYHHIYFLENESIKNNEDDAAVRAKWCGDHAQIALEDNKYDQAAFYLGAMTHYIADMSMYAHVAENNIDPYYVNFDAHHSQVEDYVKSRTNNHAEPEEFFQIFTFTPISKSPYQSAVDLAKDTYFDLEHPGLDNRNAFWLHQHFFTGWAASLAERQLESNQTHTNYYDRIERNLNNAIEACAAALLYELIHSAISITTNSSTQIDSTVQVFSILGYNYFIFIGCGISIVILRGYSHLKRKKF